MRDDRERLLDMLEAIRQIEKYSSRGEEAFRSDELIQNRMTWHIQVIGEAARALSDEFRNLTPDSLVGHYRHASRACSSLLQD